MILKVTAMPIEACWAHLTGVFPPQPRVRVRVTNFADHKSLDLNVMVDTGFSGYLSLHEDAIRELNLEPLGSCETSTVGGIVKAKVYLAKVEILDSEGHALFTIHRFAQDSFVSIDDEIKSLEHYPVDALLIHGFGLPLIGLRGLMTRNWALFNSHNALCLLK